MWSCIFQIVIGFSMFVVFGTLTIAGVCVFLIGLKGLF